MSGVFVMDGSRRSGHSNAYFAGLGRFRKIVLFDTLMKQLTDDELVAVLAHEMGHNAKKHILSGTIISAAILLIGLFVLSILRNSPEFYAAFGVPPSAHAVLVLFMLVSGSFMAPIEPLMNLWMRRNEYQADAFSVEVMRDPAAMKSALIKLARDNLSNLDPHPAYSFYHYTHPTTAERIRAIDAIS
jgi:STE24 endopeptidase